MRNGWVPAAERVRMLCKITCRPLEPLSCKEPLGKAIFQKQGKLVPAVTKSKYVFILDGAYLWLSLWWFGLGDHVRVSGDGETLLSVLILDICICILSLLICRQPPPCEHYLDVAKTVLWPHCTRLNIHVLSSSWNPSSCHYLLGFIIANHFYIGCACAEVSACCLSPA